MPTQAAERIDLAFRPKGYFWPLGVEKHLLTHIKGAARRAMLERLIEEGRFGEIPAALAKTRLTDEERAEIGRIHPRLMGGEYLPDMSDDEVEIARIEIASTTFDVTSVYARRKPDGRIQYRVVDEYDGGTLTGKKQRVAAKPLTLGELESFFLGSWRLLEVLQMNFDGDVEAMLDFFVGRSEFYPDFDQLLRQRVVEAFSTDQDAETETDGIDGGVE
jgi:hypothetical protein